MTETGKDDMFLDALFSEAREDAQDAASPDLLARVLQDAEAEQDSWTSAPAPVDTAAPRGVFATFVEALGGWPALGGLAMAGVAGVWIGVAPPEALSAEMAAVLGDDTALVMGLGSETGFFGELADAGEGDG